MSIEVRNLPIVTITDEDGDWVRFKTNDDGSAYVETANGVVITTIDELEAVVKALKGGNTVEPSKPSSRAPGEIRVGDKVRVTRNFYYTSFYGKGAEGVAISTDGCHASAGRGRPIVIQITRFGNDCATPTWIKENFVDYTPDELEVIEEAK